MKAILSLVTVAACLAASAARADKLDLATIPCGGFAKSDNVTLTNVALWLNGYCMGNTDDPIIDFDKVNNLGNAPVKYCAANPTMKVSDAAEKIMGNAK